MNRSRPAAPRRGAFFATVLALAILVVSCGGEEYVPSGIFRIPAPDLSDMTMPDVTNDTERPIVARDDGLLIVYFGYTYCPDVCPTTMTELRQAIAHLGDDDAARIDVAMVTVDPERDTPDVLTSYVHAFAPDGFAVRTADPDRLAALAEPFGAQYSLTTREDGYVEVVHTGFLYAVDDQGLLRMSWPFGIEDDPLADDLQALLDDTIEEAA